MNVAVVGCGYVGLVTGVGLASLGHSVVGIETDPERRAAIETGRAPFHEPGLDELLAAELAAGRYRVEGTPEAVRGADVIMLAVQTPSDASGGIELEFLGAAADAVAAELGPAGGGEPPVVVVRSTVVPGTLEEFVAPRLEGLAAVASNPEFLREGSAVADFLHPDRVVVGCADEAAGRRLAELYAPTGAPVVVTAPAAAELAKYASNAFLATLISFSNEIGRVAESLPGVDVEDVLGILYDDGRLSPRVDGRVVRPGILSYVKAGCGYGGSCLPKDLAALIASRSAAGHRHPLLEAVREVNETQADGVVALAERRLGSLEGRPVTVLGAAFKGGTDDLRSSPGLRVVARLLERGARVTLYDPLVAAAALAGQEALGVRVAPSLAESLAGAEAVVVTTNAPEFEALPGLLGNGAAPLVVDGRRFLSAVAVGDERYVAVGRGPARP